MRNFVLVLAFSLAFLILINSVDASITTRYVPSTPLITDNVTSFVFNDESHPTTTDIGTTLTAAQYSQVNVTDAVAFLIDGVAASDAWILWNFSSIGGGEINWIFVTAKINNTVVANEFQHLDLWNFTDSSFVTTQSFASSATLTNRTFNISGTNLTHFMNSANTTLYLAPHLLGPSASDMWVDVLEIIVDKPTPPVTFCTGSDPYENNTGSWTVTGVTTCNNEDFGVNGNITINAGGNLTLNKTNMRLDSTANNSFLNNNGNLTVVNYSNISTNASNIFQMIDSTGNLNFTDSIIEKSGWSAIYFGVDHSTGTFYMKNTTINNAYRGLNFQGITTLTQIVNNSIINIYGDDGIAFQSGFQNKLFNISGNVITSSVAGVYGILSFGSVSVNESNFTYNIINTPNSAIRLGTNVGNNYLHNIVYARPAGLGILQIGNAVATGSWKANISNNTVYDTGGSTSDGIQFVANNYSEIRGNTIVNVSERALFLSSAMNVWIQNNTINSTGGDGVNIAGTGADNNTLIDNTINTSGGDGLDISVGSHRIINNVIKTTLAGVNGITITTANNLIDKNNITGTLRGIFISADNNYINLTNITITATNGNALQISSDGNNTTMVEGRLNMPASPTGKQVSVNAGDLHLINISNLNKTLLTTVSGVHFNVSWYVDVNVTNSTNHFLENANVSIYDNMTKFLVWNLTNASGLTSRHVIQEYMNNSGTVTNYTGHNFSTVLSGYDNNNTIFEITSAMIVKIIMSPEAAGALTILNFTDYVFASEKITNNELYIRSLSDYLQSHDSLVKSALIIRYLSDNVQSFESITKQNIYGQILSDYLAVSDSFTRQTIFTRNFNDYVLVNDALLKNASFRRDLTDYVNANDAFTKGMLFTKLLSDYISVFDEKEKNLIFNRVLTDYVNAFERIVDIYSPGGAALTILNIIDSIIANEKITRLAAIFSEPSVYDVCAILKQIGTSRAYLCVYNDGSYVVLIKGAG